MLEKLAATPLGTAAKTFLAVVIGAAVADWSGAGDISLANLETWVIAGLVAAIPVVIDYLNPEDHRYGRTK